MPYPIFSAFDAHPSNRSVLIRVLCITLGLFLSWPAIADPLQPFSLTTERGARIAVIEQYPTGNGPFPAVILASGSRYHMRLPVQEQTAEALVNSGFAVFRFDWAYYLADPEKGTQSNNRQLEVEDLNRLLSWVRQQQIVDQSQIILAGKSLGSIVAWEVFRQHPDITAAILLTPVCNDRGEIKRSAETLYPGVKEEQRSSLWLIGDKDPVCSLSRIYRFATEAPGTVRVAALSGDHSFEGIPDSAETIQIAADLIRYFSQSILQQRVEK